MEKLVIGAFATISAVVIALVLFVPGAAILSIA